MILPFVALQNLEWKVEITEISPKLVWVLYKKQMPSDSTSQTWVQIEPIKQIETLNEIISYLLKEKFCQEENERFIPGY